MDGKELCIYKNGAVEEWSVYGADNVGKLLKGEDADIPLFYLKDHLGSVRAITDERENIISAQDYDAWGYLLQGRKYESSESKFKFTSNERDNESTYDYFGARYYDARIGRWGVVDPVSDFEPSLTPYHYSNNNPLKFVDLNGLDYFFYLPGSNSEGFRVPRFGENEYYFYSLSGDYTVNSTGDYSFLNGLTFFKGNSKTTKDFYFSYTSSYSPGDIDISFESFGKKLIKDALSKLNYTPYNLPFGLINESRDKHLFDYKVQLNNWTLYLFDGYVYNKEEAGNVLWGATMAHFGVFPAVVGVPKSCRNNFKSCCC